MEATHLSTNEGRGKQNVAYTNDGMLFGLCYPWMNLKDIMLKWKKEFTKGTYPVWPHLYELPRIVKFIETEGAMAVPKRLRREGNGELVFDGYRVSVLQYEKSSVVGR